MHMNIGFVVVKPSITVKVRRFLGIILENFVQPIPKMGHANIVSWSNPFFPPSCLM